MASVNLSGARRWDAVTAEMRERRLKPWSIKVESRDLRLPKIKFLVRAIILSHRVKLLTMNTSYPYAIHLLASNAWDRLQELGRKIESILRSYKA